MKKPTALLLLIVLLGASLSLSGCSPYTRHYSTIAMVTTTSSDKPFMSFYSFEGRQVFTINARGESNRIKVSAKLESGSAVIRYDAGEGLTDFLTVRGGDEISTVIESLPKGRIYLLVDTEEKCINGDFHFELEK